ncbi:MULTISPECIES: DUF4189 domain-containing protein [unclassified Gordonia (in: high G+C Gram-positive bacteria)]|uniref:DUF4189 domain-containing protein n=1 Tax=unclassified Gordonia (in: high G+C Gram-positive bacteria) TaxID=2657482 RepID=UPI001F0F1E59|nr:DUF4189 domain-containing protein [Gordonia sp. ABSL49_1]MCH5644188.1 DUF4189 domain-containing protein [Gordonia sp. ABSL49_1]
MNKKFIASIGIAASLAAGGTALSAAGPADAARDYWGAIAFDNNGRTATAYNYPTAQSAINRAKALCGSHCGQFSFVNSCGAIAYTNSKSRWAWARGYPSRYTAERAALNRLGSAGYVARWTCTAR